MKLLATLNYGILYHNPSCPDGVAQTESGLGAPGKPGRLESSSGAWREMARRSPAGESRPARVGHPPEASLASSRVTAAAKRRQRACKSGRGQKSGRGLPSLVFQYQPASPSAWPGPFASSSPAGSTTSPRAAIGMRPSRDADHRADKQFLGQRRSRRDHQYLVASRLQAAPTRMTRPWRG